LKETISVQDVLDRLNSLLALDRQVMERLFTIRFICNDAISQDPDTQVLQTQGGVKFGVVGLLNTLFGADDDGMGAIAAQYSPRCICNENHDVSGLSVNAECELCGGTVIVGNLVRFVRVAK